MLILTRKAGETIVVGDNVFITILGVSKGVVKIGIEAPREVLVNRQEVHNKIQDERKQRGEVV